MTHTAAQSHSTFSPYPDNEMCKWSVFIVETGKQMEAEFEKTLLPSNSVNNCSNHCLDSLDKYGFVCRSFMFDEENQNCALYEEDPLEQGSTENQVNRKLIPSKGNLYRVLCSTDDKGKSFLLGSVPVNDPGE